jgi:glycosyltransferase involved in cell wall biosynthesis
MRIILDLQACQASSMQRGIGRYSMALALAMARNSGGHDLRIALNEGFPDSVATLRRAFDGLVPPEHIGTYAVPAPAAEADPANGWRIAAAERIREHYLASLRPDVVHVASLFEGLSDDSVVSVPPAGGHFDTAVTLYDLIPLLNQERYLGDPNIARWYHRKLESLKRAQLLLAISGHARSEAIDVLGLDPASVVDISSAVDDIFRPRALAPDARAALLARHGIRRAFIMYTGGIDWRKNIEGLIEAYALLPGETRRHYQLAVVCSIHEPDRVRLQRLAAKCGLASDDLVLTGFVSDDDLVSLYNSTTLFVFPSLHEGFGLPALEAMACGAAVIGSNRSSIPEVIGRADALFDPASSAAIGAAMAAVLDDPARQAVLRAHGLRQAARFSWDASAKRALAAFEEAHGRRTAGAGAGVTVAAPARPRLAYVSPLPPERSGIAGYSADLLPELARHYDIDLVLAPERSDLPYVPDAFPQRSVAWFEEHARAFDRIVYQFGNSTFHTHMFDLLERHPGVVVLHDFFLSGVLSHTEPTHALPNNYARTLYLSHGYAALAYERREGRFPSVSAFPCNRAVLERALGVIVHSYHAAALAERWYGAALAGRLRVLPLLRTMPDTGDRAAARQALEVKDDDFLVCSFGIVSAPKCNDRIVEAWLDSTLASDPRCHLVFVGEAGNDRFGLALRDRIKACPRIRITGYVDDEAYRHYLAAADAAIQLRRGSRGETSAGVLDCMAAGLPTIINAHGSAAEVPADTCVHLDDAFSDDALRDALKALRSDAPLRSGLGARAAAYMRAHHAPAHVGALYRKTLEDFALESDGAAEAHLLASIATLDGEPAQSDLFQVAAAIAANRPRCAARQWLVDVTALAAAPYALPTATQRELVRKLLVSPPAGCRVEPVRYDGQRYHYARQFTLSLMEQEDLMIEDAVADAGPGDVLLALDPAAVPHLPPAWRARGVVVAPIEDAQAV